MSSTEGRPTRLTSLAELGPFFGIESDEALDDLATIPLADDAGHCPPPIADPGGGAGDATASLDALVADLDAATAALAAVARQDRVAREAAEQEVAGYDALVAALRAAEAAHERAHQVRREAERLVATAFTDEARAAATDVARLATRAERAAAHAVEERRRDAERVAARPAVARLLAERRRQEEEAAQNEKAAAAARAGRLSAAIASTRAALDAGSLEEARVLLGAAANEFPDNAEIASLQAMIAQRERAVKVAAAEEALWAARREHRHQPAEAVARLSALDVAGLPQPLAGQVFGEWARACARLCHERGIAAPLRYAPDPGRGAVLAPREAGEGYAVVSALGMDEHWRPGSVVGAGQARGARPLRSR